jgi:spore maturation protein CgeB
MTNLVFYGSSLLSSYWNGAATYYRGILKAMAARGYEITFYEPDAFDRQKHRDIEPPDWAKVVVYPATEAGLQLALAGAPGADIVVKASGVGVFDAELLAGVSRLARPDAVKLIWDVDAPATLAEIEGDPSHPTRRLLPQFDGVLTYGGGEPVIDAYRRLGARCCVPIYNALDPDTHFPVPADPRFSCDLAFLGNRLPDREARVRDFFFEPARLSPERTFLLGGSGWEPHQLPANVRHIGHVGTADHNAFNTSPGAVLNIARDAMAKIGFSPATRVFEAAGAGACIISDAWEGIELFLQPDQEILVARSGADVAGILADMTTERSRSIGEAARRRVLADHTYASRAALLEDVLGELTERKRIPTKRKVNA